MISLHKNQLAIWILLYILNYTTSSEYGTIWTNFNNKQLCGVPPSTPWKALQRLYYDNSNEIIGLKQIPYINGPRYGKVNVTNFGNYETINNKHGTDPIRRDHRDQIIENTNDNVLLSSRRKTFSLIGYDEEIYKIMQKFTMSGQTGSILIYFYLSQNHTYSRIGLLRTTPRMMDFILSKYNYFNCVNSNHIMIPRENNIFYADECLKDCDKLVTKYINLNNNDNMESYVDYFTNNCLNGKDNYQNNLVINSENNFNTNDSPAINHLHLPHNNYKSKANPNIFLPHDSENINDSITDLKNKLNENNKNNYADILNSDVANKLLTDMNKNSIDKYYSDEPSTIRDNEQNVHSGLYYNSIPVQEFMSHPSHLESNECKFKAQNNDNNFETIKNNVDIQTTNTSPAENHINVIILDGNFIKENFKTPEINYDPSSNNKIDTYISYGKNKNLTQIYNAKDDERAVDNIPYNINYKEDQNGQLVFPYKSTSSEIFDTALANNQIEYLPSQELFPKQYLNLPKYEANYSIPRKLAYSLIKPDKNIQKISSADATYKNTKPFNYVKPRLCRARAQTFDSESINSNPSLQYTFNPETGYNMPIYNIIETNESKPSVGAQPSAITCELKSTSDGPKMNEYILSENGPDVNTLTHMNTPTALQRPSLYVQKELPSLDIIPSQRLNSNTFKQNLKTLPLLAYKEPVQVNYKKINSDYIPSVSYTPYSFSKPHSVSPKQYSPTNFISPPKLNLKPWYETTQTTNKNPTKLKAITIDSSIVTPNSPKRQQHNIFMKPRKLITNPPLNIPCNLVPIQLDKTYNPESNINDISMDDLSESKSKYLPRGDGKLHSLQTPFREKYDEFSPRHTNKENIPSVKFVQWKPLSLAKYFIKPNYPYNVANHKNKATPFVTPSQVYQTIPKTNDLIPLDVEYTTSKKPSFYDSQKPNKVVSVFPKTDSTENYKTSVVIPQLPFKKALIPPTYQSLLHKKAPTWVQKYQPIDAFPGQNVNQNLFTKNLKSDDNREREPIIDLSKATMGMPQYKVFNAQKAKYYCPSYPAVFNMQNDNNYSPTTTTKSSTSRNETPHLKELTNQEAVSHTTEPQNKSNEEQSISNGIASPCYFPPLSQTSKTYKPQISEELKELTQQEIIPCQSDQRNFKHLELPLASSTSYKNPSLCVPNDLNNIMSPNPQLATLSTATNHPSTVVQNSPAVNCAQPLKILDKKEYFKSPNVEYYNPTSKGKANPFITPLTPRVEFLPPKRTNMDLLNAAYFPSKINTICSNTAFDETPKLSDIDDTNNNLTSVEVPKVPPRMSLNRDGIKNIKNTPSTRIDQHTPSWMKKYYHYPLQTPHNLPIQMDEQNNFKKPAIPKQDSINIQEKEPSADLGQKINQPYPNENTAKYYSPLQRNPSFTDKQYSIIPKPNCNRYNMPQSQHQTLQNQYFPVIESQKETKLGQNRITESYDFPTSQILQSYKPQSLEVPKLSKQNDELTPQSKTKVTEFEPAQHQQPDFQNVNFCQANGSSYRKPPLNPYNLKSTLRNVQPAKVPTATNQQSNLNFNQERNMKELNTENLYSQRNGQGLPNLANKGPVSSTPYIHKHPPFECTHPMWTILPLTLSNNSLEPKQQVKLSPIENSLKQNIKRYKNIPCYASGEDYKIQNPKLNYDKPFHYEVNGYYPKISKQKGLQPCVSNTAEFYDPLILKPQTMSSQAKPTNLALEPTRFSSPKKLWTQAFNHDLRTPEYFPTFSPAQIIYNTPLLTKNVISMKKPFVCGNNNKKNYYTNLINPSSIRKTIFTPNLQHTISVEEPTEYRNNAHRKESPIVYQLQFHIHKDFTKLSTLNKPLYSLSKPSQFNEMPPQLMSVQKKSKLPINYSNKNINFINDIKEQTPSESTHVPCEIKDYHKFNFTDKHNKWPAKYLKSYTAPIGYSATALPCPVKSSPIFDQSSRKSTTALPFVSPAPSTIVSKKSQPQKSLASYDQIPQALIKMSSTAPTEKRKYNIWPPKYSQTLSTPRPIPSSSNPFMLTNIGKAAHPSIRDSLAKNIPQPKIKFIQEPFSNLQQNPPYSSPISRNQGRYKNQVNNIAENHIEKKPVSYIQGESRTDGVKYHNIKNYSPCSLLSVPILVNSYSPSSSIKGQKSWIPKPHAKSRFESKIKASPSLKYNTMPTSAVAPIINITPSLYTRPNPYECIPFEDLKYSGDNHRISTLPVVPIINKTPYMKRRSNPYKYTPFEDHKDSGDNHRIPTLPLAPIINIIPSLKSNPYKYTPQKDLKDSGGNHRILASEKTPITSIAPSFKTRPNAYKYTPAFKKFKDSDDNHRIPTSAVTPFINITPCHKTRSNPFKYMPKFKNMKYSGGNHRIPTLAESPIINLAPFLRTQLNPYKYTPTFNDYRDSSGNHRITTSTVAPIINLIPSPETRINPYKYTPTFKYHNNSDGDQRIPTSAVASVINIIPPLKTRPNSYKYTPTHFEDQIDGSGNIKIPTSAKAPILNIKPTLKTLSNPYKYTPTFNDRTDSGKQGIPTSAVTPIINISSCFETRSNPYKYAPTFKDLNYSGRNHRIIQTSAESPIINITPSLKTRLNPYKYTPTYFKDQKDGGGNFIIPTSGVPIINMTPYQYKPLKDRKDSDDNLKIPTSAVAPYIAILPFKTQSNPYKHMSFKDLKDSGGNHRIRNLVKTPIINTTPFLKTRSNPYKYTPSYLNDRKDRGYNYRIQTSAESPIIKIAPYLKTRPNPYKYRPFEDFKESGVTITSPLGTRSNPYYKYTPSLKDLKYSAGNHKIPTSAAAPIINITPSLKTRPNRYKYIPFEGLQNSGGNHIFPTSALAPIINITASLKTRPNPYKYTPTYFKYKKDGGGNFIIPTSTINMTPYKYTPFKDRKDSGDNPRVQTSAESPIINIAPSLKTRPNPYKYKPFADLKDSDVNIKPPLGTRSNPYYKNTPSFKDLKYSEGNHRIPTSAAAPIINIAPSLKTRPNPYKYKPFEDLKDIGANITPPFGTRSNPYYKYTPSFKDLKYSGGNHRMPTSAAAPIINITPSLKRRPSPYKYTPFEDLKDSGANITPPLRTRFNPYYKYTPSFKDLKYNGGNHRDPTSVVAPIINISPLRAQINPYENTPTFKCLKDNYGNYRICTSAETPIIKITPSSNLSKYTPIFKEPKVSAGNKRIGDLMNLATYTFEQYSPCSTRFYDPTQNIKPRKLLPTTVQSLQPIVNNVADFELQKPKLQDKPLAFSAPLYKIVNDNIIGNTVNNIKHTTSEGTPCNVLNPYNNKKSEMYYTKQPTKAAYFSQNRPYNRKEKTSISSSQIPAVSWAPQNILSPAQTVISKGTLQNGNVLPRLTENTSNLYETNAPLPKVLGSTYNILQDNVDTSTHYKPSFAVPPTRQFLGKILPVKQSPMQFADNLLKNIAVHKNVDPVQNILYSNPMQGNQHNTKEFTDLRDNYVKSFKCTTCDCKVSERNPTILDQIMKQLYAYSKTLPDKFYESRAGFTNGNISIPFCDMGLAKYEVTKPNEFLKTEIPGLFIKAWGSRIKIIRPRLVLDVKEYEGYNFMPVIKNHYYSPEFAQNVARDIVTRLYGEPIVIDGVYSPTSPYAVIDDINNALVNDGKAYILWPTLCNCGCMKSGCKCCFRN